MATSRESEHHETISGQLMRVTYHDAAEGYFVGHIEPEYGRGTVCICGVVPSALAPGQELTVRGEWTMHPAYGRQFRFQQIDADIPVNSKGIVRYLGSGLIEGIGPKMAQRMVDCFGAKTLEIIVKYPEKLREVEGIGRKRAGQITAAWEEQNVVRDIMVFLYSHGLSPAFAARVFARYGQDSILVLRENPYQLCRDINGIGFVKADLVAKSLGIPQNSPFRVAAGVLHSLQQSADNGHVFMKLPDLQVAAAELLAVEPDLVVAAVTDLTAQKQLVLEEQRAYLPQYYKAESELAADLLRVLLGTKVHRTIDLDIAIDWVQKQLNLELAPGQEAAVRAAVEQKLLVITGGPGTGKTTIVRAIVDIYRGLKQRILLAAPTGRAAKRMSQACHWEAKTVHRLLEYDFRSHSFVHNADNQLTCGLVVIDEASMLDCRLAASLLAAMPDNVTLVLVGDIDQLPSVGPGNVLRDVIGSEVVPVARLDRIFRQAAESMIVTGAHRINEGLSLFPEERSDSQKNDLLFIPAKLTDETKALAVEMRNEIKAITDPAQKQRKQNKLRSLTNKEYGQSALELMLDFVTTILPKRYQMDPITDVQVLTPMNSGPLGTEVLNNHLQRRLNKSKLELVRRGRSFRLGDKVMQIRNNYDKEVFNGDIGIISQMEVEDKQIWVTFEKGRNVRYEFTDIDQLVLAYAVTVHKSQGSEYRAIVVPIMTQHYIMLQRNLIYTAITRGKELVVLVGMPRAMAIAIDNNRISARNTYLDERLKQLFNEPLLALLKS